MKVTLLGHASVLVEMQGARCLMDPVFQDPFEDGAVESCPSRVVHAEKLPPIDLLIISHSHLDHFDIPSLARLPRTCDVLCPKDQAITYALQQLGFTKIRASEPMTHLVFPGHELLTTHSNVSNVVEFGVVFKDETGTFWNQVDTVVAPQTVQLTRQKCPQIDLLFAMYASQNFGFFESKPVGFPVQMHQMNLQNVVAIAPGVVVPGSAGFCFRGPMAWCNSFLFPISRERFVADLAQLAPDIKSCIANPGDVFELDRGTVRHLPGASPVASLLAEDTSRLRFDPTAAVPPLSDPNAEHYSAEQLRQAAEVCLQGLGEFVLAAYRAGDPVVEEYRRLGASYAVGVVFPESQEQWWRIRFNKESPHIESGPAAALADAGHRIAASALASWLAHKKSYFYLRAFSRKFTTLYSLAKSEGQVLVEPAPVQDLLGYYLQWKAKGAELALKRWLDLQLQPYVQPPAEARAPVAPAKPAVSWPYRR
jgi:hypothetical protein